MDQGKPQNPAQKSAQKYFTKSAHDEAAAKDIRKKERKSALPDLDSRGHAV